MPTEKLTYKQIVHKIIYYVGNVKEIADLIVRARKNPPDKDAVPGARKPIRASQRRANGDPSFNNHVKLL